MKPKIHCDLCGDGPELWAITILCWAKKNMYFGLDKCIWRQILSFSMHELPMKQLERDRRLRYGGGALLELIPIMFEGHYFSTFLFFLCPRCFVKQKCAICTRTGILRDISVGCVSDDCLKQRIVNADVYQLLHGGSHWVRPCEMIAHNQSYCSLSFPAFRCAVCNVNVCYDCRGSYVHQCHVVVRTMPNVRTFTRVF